MLSCAGAGGSGTGSDMSDEDELDGMSNLTSEEDGSVYLMDGEVTPLQNCSKVARHSIYPSTRHSACIW